ncbi:MAG: hypothetical protein E7382_01650 [Clostridiales bacterium]|nr:hypothetical protein [Clostridiales bacterium]
MRGKSKKKASLSQADFKEALIKKALGYDATEVVEEYVSSEEGEVKLTKKKVTKKNVPPDITAIKILLEDNQTSIEDMSDEELEREKTRLLKLLGESIEAKEK